MIFRQHRSAKNKFHDSEVQNNVTGPVFVTEISWLQIKKPDVKKAKFQDARIKLVMKGLSNKQNRIKCEERHSLYKWAKKVEFRRTVRTKRDLLFMKALNNPMKN